MSKQNTNTTAVKRGRPVVAGSKRQAVLAMRDAKRNAGIEVKRGRPKKQVTVEVDVTAKTKTVKSKAQKQAKLATVATMEDFVANVTDGEMN